jgi:hypothetical protein
MNDIKYLLPNFKIEDTDVLCSDVHGNMAVGKLEYDVTAARWVCVKFVSFRHETLLFDVVWWEFTSEIFEGLAASEPSKDMCFHSFD